MVYCKLCGRYFKSIYNLKVHVFKAHVSHMIYDGGNTRYKCPYCNVHYTTLNALIRHCRQVKDIKHNALFYVLSDGPAKRYYWSDFLEVFALEDDSKL